MTNEAAEHLHFMFSLQPGNPRQPHDDLDAALAAERRPLLEILRRAAAGWEVGPGPHTVPLPVVNEIVNVLHDAEAARAYLERLA